MRTAGAGWVIDGQKVWTSWAEWADWCFVVTRTDPDSKRHAGLTYLLVPMKQPGVTIRPMRQITGDAEFSEVFCDGARTARGNSLGAPGDGWKVAMATLAFERGVSTPEADERVRLRVGDAVYEPRAERGLDADVVAAVRAALERKYALEAGDIDPAREIWIFRLAPRRAGPAQDPSANPS